MAEPTKEQLLERMRIIERMRQVEQQRQLERERGTRPQGGVQQVPDPSLPAGFLERTKTMLGAPARPELQGGDAPSPFEGVPNPLQALIGALKGTQRVTGEAPPPTPDAPGVQTLGAEQGFSGGLVSNEPFNQLIREDPGVRGTLGQLTLPVATGLAAGRPIQASGVSPFVAEPLLFGAVEAVQQAMGQKEVNATDIMIAAGAPVAVRGLIQGGGAAIRKGAQISRAGRLAKQTAVQTERTRLQRNFEQARQEYIKRFATVKEADDALRADAKKAQEVQTNLRNAMQDRQRALNRVATAERTRNVGRAQQFVKDIPVLPQNKIDELYAAVDGFDVQLPAQKFQAAQKQLRDSEQLLADFPGLRSEAIGRLGAQGRAGVGPATPEGTFGSLSIQETIRGGVEQTKTFSFQQVMAALKRLKQRHTSLLRSTDPQAREQLGATARLIGALEETLDDAATTPGIAQEARSALNLANAAYKKMRTVEELSTLTERFIKTQTDGTQVFNPAGLRDLLRKGVESKTVVKRLKEIGVYDELTRSLDKMAKATERPPQLPSIRQARTPRTQLPPEPQAPELPRLPFDEPIQQPSLATESMTAVARGVAGAAGATLLGAGPTVAAATTLAAMTISRALTTKPGQKLLLTLMKPRGGALADASIRLLSVAVGQAAQEGMDQQEVLFERMEKLGINPRETLKLQQDMEDVKLLESQMGNQLPEPVRPDDLLLGLPITAP